jgi:hypothetical protein
MEYIDGCICENSTSKQCAHLSNRSRATRCASAVEPHRQLAWPSVEEADHTPAKQLLHAWPALHVGCLWLCSCVSTPSGTLQELLGCQCSHAGFCRSHPLVAWTRAFLLFAGSRHAALSTSPLAPEILARLANARLALPAWRPVCLSHHWAAYEFEHEPVVQERPSHGRASPWELPRMTITPPK